MAGDIPVTPSPLPSERPAGRGVHRKCPQNLDGKELRGQNLENKGLTFVFLAESSIASALNMMS
jgi:hypothetical protein